MEFKMTTRDGQTQVFLDGEEWVKKPARSPCGTTEIGADLAYRAKIAAEIDRCASAADALGQQLLHDAAAFVRYAEVPVLALEQRGAFAAPDTRGRAAATALVTRYGDALEAALACSCVQDRAAGNCPGDDSCALGLAADAAQRALVDALAGMPVLSREELRALRFPLAPERRALWKATIEKLGWNEGWA